MNNPQMHPITEDDIANYLANTPDFFERHAQLLAAVQLTSPHGNRAVSLQERQAEMLREKIKALEHRIMDMVRHGNENQVIADRIYRWARDLFLVQSGRVLPAAMVAQLQSQFMVPQAAMKVSWRTSATATRSCGPPASASSPPPTPSAAASSATSTTARSSTSSPWPSTSGWRRTPSPRTPTSPPRCCPRWAPT